MQDSLRCDDVVVTASERAGRGPHKGGRINMSFVLHWTQRLTRRTAGVMTTAVAMATIATAITGPIPAAAAGASRHGDLARDRAAQLLPHTATRSVVPRIGAPACNSQFNIVAGANPGGFVNIILNNAMVAV